MSRPVIYSIGVSLPDDAGDVRGAPAPADYVAQLVDDGAALIVVDGDRDDFVYWTAAPKTSPATRRVPVIVVTGDPARRADALRAGADFALAPADFAAQIRDLIAREAYLPTPEVLADLACDCAGDLPPQAVEGIERFNAGEYYRQHDLFEALWVATERPVRDLYRAILQVGVAYYQIERGNYQGAVKMLLRSVQWLRVLPDTCQGVDVAALRADSAAVRAALEILGPDGIADFDRSLLKPVRRVSPP
jgi:predicted metal-dependent hydrolase